MTVISRAGPELTTTELYNILRLRADIFVVEQECPFSEIDGVDLEPSTSHLWLGDNDGIASYLRVAATSETLTTRVGRVVTRKDRRGQGLSATLLNAAHTLVGDSTTLLDAQSHLVSFYERFGYRQAGDGFLEDGIPHVPMKRTRR